MDDLDKKLDGMVDELANAANNAGLKGLVFTWGDNGIDWRVRIKQAFIDAGWRDVMRLEDRARLGQFVTNRRVDLLSGQEWYDRLEKQVEGFVRGKELPRDVYVRSKYDVPATFGEFLAAAKKAAGIE